MFYESILINGKTYFLSCKIYLFRILRVADAIYRKAAEGKFYALYF